MTGRLASERLRRLVTERSRADQTGVTLESVPHEEAAPPGAAEVTGRADVRRYRVVEATPSQVKGTNFARLDAAVLRIEPLPDGPQDVPDALTVSADPDGPLGHLASYCIVGHPAQPVYESGTIEGVDWAWVTRTLFGNVYGVKRLAPGMTHRPLGSLPGDKRRWVFGHDAPRLFRDRA